MSKLNKIFSLSSCLRKVLLWMGVVLMLHATSSCSVTKNLPEGEILYTGYKIDYLNPSTTQGGKAAQSEVDAALDKSPSTKLFGILPFPFGMWVYNDFVHSEKKLGKFIFNKFAANPVFISTVNPDVRVKIATNVLYDYGYFNAKVNSKTIVNPKDSLKASIVYNVKMNNPYFVDTIYNINFNPRMERILNRTNQWSLLKSGEQFNVSNLDQERTRVSDLFRNLGYFYFRPDYITYQADTINTPGKVAIRMLPVAGLPEQAQRIYYVGQKSVILFGRGGEVPNDSTEYKGLKIFYYDKLKVRPDMLYRWINYQSYHKNDSVRAVQERRLYSQYRQQKIQEKLAQTGIFSYMNFSYTPKDTTASCDTLNAVFQAALAKPLDAELEFNVMYQSTAMAGPSASFSVTKYNVFGGGESWNTKLKGMYQWQTGKTGKKDTRMNSWEMGLETSLTYPRVFFPGFKNREFDNPATTTFKIYIDQLNRSKYYKLLAFGGNVTYDFQNTAVHKFSVTPFKLTFSVLQSKSAEFDSIANINPALYVSLENQFIPAMSFMYTYDNSSIKRIKNPSWWQTTITPAGNLFSCIYAAFGQPFNKPEKKLLGTPFAQFLKINSEYRYLQNINRNNAVAFRVAGGAIWAYGNRLVAPYSEQFYIGGANSVRAFAVRGIGPGGTPPQTGKYGYLDQTGSIRMEANVEWRFRLYGDLWGATFLDAGNVWLMRYDKDRPYGQLQWKTFPKQVALGTGVGVRYDLSFLILRIDIGVPLHDPWETGKKSYYNVEGKFIKNCTLNFGIGYPF